MLQEEVVEQLKKTQIELLKYFRDICEKNHLVYFLIGGSCLGAVRHKGFIPWDDDIDVGMPRGDYEKFLTIAQKELPSNIFLQTAQTDKNYPLNFAKLRNSNTTFIETSVKNLKINHGVYIDIFPLDGYRNSFIFKLSNKIYTTQISTVFYRDMKSVSFLTKIKLKIAKLFSPNYKKVRDKREKLLKKFKYEECKMIANYCGAWGAKEIMEKEIFGVGSRAKFEELDVIIPEKFDLYLKKLYDNYMEFPPEEKRIPHHFCERIDVTRSYKHFMK